MKFLSISWLLLIIPTSVSYVPARGQVHGSELNVTTFPSQAITGDVVAQYISDNYRLDGPKLSAINTTAWDWWYFDVVAEDLKTTLVVVFFMALDSGFPFLEPSTDVDVVGVFYSYPNGDSGLKFLDASEAVIITNKDGSSGEYVGAGAQWIGAPDLSKYELKINSPENGIVGTFCLESRAPAHYPCGPIGANMDMMVAPRIGWANAIPDADGTVDMIIDGEELKFEGVAYHDKNWSDQPFVQNVASWYWGRVRLGPYSVVWFDTLGVDGNEYVSGYASLNNSIISATCLPNTVKVRPIGTNYPPSYQDPYPTGYTIEMDLGAQGTLNVNVSVVTVISNATQQYQRWTGSAVGSVGDGTLFSGGVSLFEQFRMVS